MRELCERNDLLGIVSQTSAMKLTMLGTYGAVFLHNTERNVYITG